MRLRNRWTKATFWTDGALLRWPRDKRHFYQSLWACAEDSCCIEDDMFEVKLTAWASPLDADMTVELFETWRDELIADDKLVPYTNGDPNKRYLYLPDMAKHENPRNPQAPDIPLPPWVGMDVSGDGRDRRVRFTHGDRTEMVQSVSGDRNTSPALSCPVLPATDLDKEPREAIPDTTPKTLSLPPCMAGDSVSNQYGTRQHLGQNIHAAAQSRWGILGHYEIAGFCGAVVDGCYENCKGDEDQRRHCHGIIVKAIEDKRMEGTFKPHRALFAKIIQPVEKGGDRQWVSD